MPELSSKLRLILAATILIPVLLYWGFSGSPHEGDKSTSPLTDKMDYFVDGAKIREWQKDGDLQRGLETIRLEHNPKREHSELTTPRSIHYRDNGTQLLTTSDTGITLDDNSRTDLAGNVIVHDNPDSLSGTTLKTEHLTIYPEKDFAETDQPVVIESPETIMAGVGMDIEFNNRIMNLHNQVKGTHDKAE